jgi:hypothetical protein
MVALVPLTASVDTSAFLSEFIKNETSDVCNESDRIVYGALKKHRSKLAFVQSVSNSVLDVVDVARVADIIVFVGNAPAQLGASAQTTKTEDELTASFSELIDEVNCDDCSVLV